MIRVKYIVFILAILCSLISILSFAQEQKPLTEAVTSASPLSVILQDREKGEIKIEGICKEVLEKTEWVAIVTCYEDSPHLVGTWGNYVDIINENTILIPAGGMHETERDLKKNKYVQLLVASRQVQGTYGAGKGCLLYGEGEIQTEGEFAKRIKEKFPWARGALIVVVKKIEGIL